MRRTIVTLAGIVGLAGQAHAVQADLQMDRYFSIWADNARITPAVVDNLYASRVVYYGKSMTTAEVYRDKLNFIRRWPDRRYQVVPGSVSKACDPAAETCRINAVLHWDKADPRTRQGSTGANTITLTLVRQDGTLKIARESGTPVAHASCRSGSKGWACSGYR